MGKLNNKPTSSRVRQTSKSIPNAMRSEELKDKSVNHWIAKQIYADKWNTEYVGVKDRHDNLLSDLFKDLQLDNHNLIVQMFMENPIKDVIEQEGNNLIVPGISQIDGRKRNTDAPNWIDTPFPLIDQGIIVAISPWLQLFYYELKDKMSKFDMRIADSILIPEVGDMITTNHFMFKETRFYPDKQKKCNDFIRNQEELRLNEFSFLFKITNYDIESIIKKESEAYKARLHKSPLLEFNKQ